MIHLRIDNEQENSKRRFACGIGPDLPKGDTYFFPGEADRAIDCPGCKPDLKPLGIPIDQLSGIPVGKTLKN